MTFEEAADVLDRLCGQRVQAAFGSFYADELRLVGMVRGTLERVGPAVVRTYAPALGARGYAFTAPDATAAGLLVLDPRIYMPVEHGKVGASAGFAFTLGFQHVVVTREPEKDTK